MVTPPVKNDAVIGKEFIGLGTYFSEDGNRVMAPTVQCFGEVGSCVGERGLEGTIYQFERGAGGWGSRAFSLPASVFGMDSVWQGDPDTGLAWLSAPLPNGPDELYRVASDGSYEPIGPVSETLRYPGEAEVNYDIATSDLSHVVFFGTFKLWAFDKTEKNGVMYEYSGVGNASPQLVGVTGPAGSTDLIGVCGTELSLDATGLSADGRTVYFEAEPCKAGGTGVNAGTPVPAYELYARVDGSRTVKISERVPASCQTAACLSSLPRDAAFQGASSDGSRAFFTSTQQLTDDATEDTSSEDSARTGGQCHGTRGFGGCNLYESDCPAHCEDPAERRLVDVSAGDSSGGGPRVQGVTAMSPDGSHIYFVAKGVLSGEVNGEGQRAESGAENLYLYDDAEPGHVTFIAQLSAEDEGDRCCLGGANVTPDGRFLVFKSHRALTRDDTRGEGPNQVYRYDAQTRTLVRISVGQDGYDQDGNTGTGSAAIVSAVFGFDNGIGFPRMDPTMSNDGSYVFFESPVGLTPGALNDVRTPTGALANNVYEWHEGTVSLISDGKDTEASQLGPLLIGASGSGADVFFKTADPLAPQDTDTQRDFYDAHICSPASPCPTPTPTTAPVPCVGEGCHSPATPSAQPAAPATSTFTGPGNLTPTPPTAAVHRTAAQLRAQKLTGALKACRKTRSKQRRAACEKRARRAYGRHT